MKPTGYDVVVEYARNIVEGRKIACKEKIQECERFFHDLENPAYELDCKDPEFVIRFIETCISHKEGESIRGEPLLGKPLLLEPWEKFIVYNLLGFRLYGSKYKMGDRVRCVSNRFGMQFTAIINGVKRTIQAQNEAVSIVLGEPEITVIGEMKLAWQR